MQKFGLQPAIVLTGRIPISILVTPHRFYSLGVHQWIHECCETEEAIDDEEEENRRNLELEEEIAVKRTSLSSNIWSLSYISFNIWFIVCNLRHVFFISSVNTWLTGSEVADCDFVSRWTNYFGLFQFCGVLFAPMAGAIIDILNRHFTASGYLQMDAMRTSCGISLILTSLLGIAFSIMSANAYSNPSDGTIAAMLLLEVAFRAFLYGSQANFISSLFPSTSFGFLYGLRFVNKATLFVTYKVKLSNLNCYQP